MVENRTPAAKSRYFANEGFATTGEAIYCPKMPHHRFASAVLWHIEGALFTNRKGRVHLRAKQRPKCAAAKMKRFLAITMYGDAACIDTCASASQEGKLVIWADGTRAPVLEELGRIHGQIRCLLRSKSSASAISATSLA